MYETPNVSVELINTAFLNKIDNGMTKEAEEAGSAYIRQKLYEDGILRRLFDAKTITADELDPQLDSDKPRVIVEKEPNETLATFVPFKGTGPRAYFEGIRFSVPFGKVESEKISKSKFELMTIRMDIMSWLKENQVKMIQQEEDSQFMGSIEDILTAAASTQTTTAGVNDTFKDAFVLGLKGMTTLRLPIGKVLMHKNTYYESTKLKMEDIGNSNVAKRFVEGTEQEETFLNYPVITTIKTDLVAENEIYFFAPQEYFCKFYLLQDATLYIKSEADLIHFHTYEAPGIGIGNTKGVFKVSLG